MVSEPHAPDFQDMRADEPMYFDATPEGSVIFDWDFAPLEGSVPASSSSLPTCDRAQIPSGAFAYRTAEECETGPGGKKTRPPKLVREVRELQESFRRLSREVQGKADDDMTQIALDQKSSQQDVLSLSESLGSMSLELQGKVCQETFEEALNEKVSQKHFQQLRQRVKTKLDAEFGVAVQGNLDQKADEADLQRLCFNVEGKADRASVQAALSQKVSWNAMSQRFICCGVAWGIIAGMCAVAFAILLYLFVQQQQKLQQLSSLNEDLSNTINRLDMHHRQLSHTFEHFASGMPIAKQLASPQVLSSASDIHGMVAARSQAFTPGKVRKLNDTYTVELVPPFSNAWVVVDASMGAPGSVCSGQADAILRAEHKIFSFYAPPAIKDDNAVSPLDALAESEKVISSDDEPIHVTAMTTTTTTFAPKAPCMIMTTSLKEQAGGSIIVLISFKRDPESLTGTNSSGMYNVSGNVQWFPQ